MQQSVWTDTKKIREFGTPEGDAKTDVLIVGGGICGVLCAYFLQREGVDCILAERGRIGGGTTKNTTAKITSQHGLIYDRLLRTLGRERASMYLAANQEAVAQYKKLAQHIDCDFSERTAGVYTLCDRLKIEREADAVNLLGFPAQFAEQLPLPLDILGAVLFPHQAQLHPLKLLAGLAENLRIYENTFVSKIERRAAVRAGNGSGVCEENGNGVPRQYGNSAPARYVATMQHGTIEAEQVIVATHFPFLNKRGSYFLKLYQSRSYVLALGDVPDIGGMYIDESGNGLSFRSYENLLLLGGGGHRTGKNGGGWQPLQSFAALAYPQAKEVYRWAAQDCMSLDKIPYIGNYSANTPGLFVASGFGKWGMTSSMVAAMLLRDKILGRKNAWGEVFSPSRSMIKPQLFLNAFEAAGNLLTPRPRRCPHMGCALRWNSEEHSWDCPCHGSRFEEDGRLIDNPAMRDAALPENKRDEGK